MFRSSFNPFFIEEAAEFPAKAARRREMVPAGRLGIELTARIRVLVQTFPLRRHTFRQSALRVPRVPVLNQKFSMPRRTRLLTDL